MDHKPPTDMNVKGRNDGSSFSFTTASGRSINVSEAAVSKAKLLFTEELKEIEGHEETLETQSRSNKSGAQIPAVGCGATKDRHVTVTNKVSLKDNILLSEETAENAISSITFTMANSRPNSISRRSLPKTQRGFISDTRKGSNESSMNIINNEFQTVSGKHLTVRNDALLEAEVMPLAGFKTAGGSSINISNAALSKAKQRFEDDMRKETNESNMNIIDNEFQTIGSQHLAVTNPILPQVEVSLSERTTEYIKSSMPLAGFKTAGGNLINISSAALSKANQRFKDDMKKETNESSIDIVDNEFQSIGGRHLAVRNDALPEISLSEGRVQNTKNVMPSIGFITAGGNSINVSEKALPKAKVLFANDFEDADRHLAVTNEALPEVLLSAGRVENTKNVISSIGFTTAGGNSINVSEKALSQAKQLFANDVEDADKLNEMDVTDKQIVKPAMQVENILFQAASSQGVSSGTKEVLLKAKSLLCEESVNFGSSPALTKTVQKRKIMDLDDDVPLKKQVTSNHFKKLRFSNEFETQRNTRNDLKNNERNENQTVSSMTTEVSIANNTADKPIDSIHRTERSKQNNDIDNSLISNEIVASTVALLADENNSGIVDHWISPIQSKESNDVANVPSSPVIGGHFIPRKRKSVGGRKKSINALQTTEDKSARKHDLKGLNGNYGRSDQSTGEKHKSLAKEPERLDAEEKYDTLVTNEFSDTELMMDFIIESANILEKRLEAALEQEKLISLKKKSKPKPTISKLYLRRKSNRNNRVSWKEISKGNVPVPCTYKELIQRNLPPEILDVTANNAVTYKFRCADFYGQDIVQNNIEGIKFEDGACLILDENGYVGTSEIKRSFLASPGVDPDLLPAGWVENHYKWIVWKLASLDRIKFGSEILSRALTPDRIMRELKYRYDREIDRSERPALRKILEKDDVASKRMVLCVSSIIECDDSAITSKSPNQLKMPSNRLILTDGWYSVQASIDQAMIKNIMSGKLKEGTKLMTYGSELLNCDQGCSPLEVPENVCLRIHTNSTRRARWDTKLGYVVPVRPMCIKLRDICLNGGLIGKIKVLIARVYPVLYHEKTLAGESIVRNARCEEKADIAYKKECRSRKEAFYAKSEEYFSEEGRKGNTKPDSIDLAAMEWNEDREKLSNEEFHSIQEQERLINKCRMKREQIRQKLESRLQASLPTPRQVTPLLKIRVIDESTSAILSNWSPSEEITDIFKEGNYISICNLTPSCRRGSELRLTAGRSAVFNQINNSNIIYPRRSFTPICDVNKPTFTPPYGEFDTVGIVVSIANEPYGMKNFQAVYLAYPNTNSQSSYLSVLFWQGISSHGYAEILTVGSSVACSNLEWRRATTWSIQMSYCTERSAFTQNPRQNHLQQPFNDLKRLITDIAAYVAMCGAEISEEAQKKSTTRMSDQYTPNKIPSNDSFHSDKQIGNCTVQELSGRSSTTARSAAIQKRLEKLHYYGEPSGLSPIVLNNSSKRVSLDFQSPVRPADAKQSKLHVSLNTKFSQNPR
ncbi:uncharacterized protein LOC143369629 [Andrena cerasifolii]|uniref:uncharacterized protein LOC143369629 n=1 Tax=Andrena cerasifolii TaxID=2819439 RepID=UPI00403807C1